MKSREMKRLNNLTINYKLATNENNYKYMLDIYTELISMGYDKDIEVKDLIEIKGFASRVHEDIISSLESLQKFYDDNIDHI